ncbi:MAG: MBL fold metallo-hydrolase [Kordiimonas sp.]
MTEEMSPKPSGSVSDNVEVADHRSGFQLENGNLDYPFQKVPSDTDVIEVADGVMWARIPLPWSLDHINVYLFDEGDSWSVVDTGSQGKRGIEAWESIDEQVLQGKPIKHVVATHMHPDHLGLAGWLVEKYDAKFSITMLEYMLAQHLWHGATDVFPEQEIQHLLKMGLNPDMEPVVRNSGFGFYKKGVHELPYSFERIEDGSLITLGKREWRVNFGGGPSP